MSEHSYWMRRAQTLKSKDTEALPDLTGAPTTIETGPVYLFPAFFL